MDCIFCKIVAGTLPSKKVYEDERALVFKDVSPAAAVHWLIVPKAHVDSLSGMVGQASDADLAHLLRVAAQVAHAHGLDQTGYRLLTNNGKDAGQIVHHLHWHLLAGEPLRGLGR
jgi:histidine triad (HIT) family protein